MIDDPRERLSRLSRASRRIAGDLDLGHRAPGDGGRRALTDARYGVLAVLYDARQVEALLASGLVFR